ncbi:MAG TPA: hypothetical protein VK666_17940 [Chryseolinea sp.]|nr:hypothetical protein [Chryseolinea sp.]
MNLDFTESMRRTSDTELIKIVTVDRGDYQEAALIAAEKELAGRNLPVERIASAKETNEAERAIKDRKANAPLEVYWAILAVILPIVFQMIMSGIFITHGYERKSRELTKWTVLGIALYVVYVIFKVGSGEEL